MGRNQPPNFPTPYIILGLLPPGCKVYIVLDLKGTFSPILFLSKLSRPIFVFEWVDPEMGISRQLTWIWLSQSFKNSPTIFDEALNKEFSHFHSKYLSSQKLPYFNVWMISC